MDADRILDVFRAFERENVRYKVIGAVALNLLGLPRATQDLEIFIVSDEDNVALLRKALRSVFDDDSIDDITAADLSGEYPAIQYVPPSGTFHIDIISRLGDTFGYDDIEVEYRDIEGIRIPVATPRMLYLMKRDTIRLQDKADAERLRERFGLEE